jgi:hypothetical protein
MYEMCGSLPPRYNAHNTLEKNWLKFLFLHKNLVLKPKPEDRKSCGLQQNELWHYAF